MPGQAEIDDRQVGTLTRGGRQGLFAVGSGHHVVPTGAQVRAEPAHDLGLVVDDQHPGHPPTSAGGWADASGERHTGSARPSGNATTIVRPPPGVSSGVRVPPIASTKPTGHREPEADAVDTRAVAEPLERLEDPLTVLGRDAGPSIDHPQLDPAAGGGSEDAARGHPAD